MYLPEVFSIRDKTKIDKFISDYNFADLVTYHNGTICSNKVPFFYDNEGEKLFGHFANNNTQLADLKESKEVLAIFSGPHAYISPLWFENKNSVPTWNFQTVQICGKPGILSADELFDVLAILTSKHESQVSSQWSMADLDPERLKLLLTKITGFQIDITDIKFKQKMSQNRDINDQRSVITALNTQNTSGQDEVAKIMSEYLDD